MQFPTQCIPCMIERAIAFAHARGDEQTAWEYLRQCLRAIADAPEGVASPYLNVTFFGDIARQFYDIPADPYAEEKADSNAFMLARKDRLRERIMQDPDPLQRALCIARTANYIDFSALRGQVSFEKLDAMLLGAENDCLGPEYERLLEELEGAKELLYLCDNAGEIVADALVAEVLRQRYPSLRLTFCVRGGPASNDALLADAEAAGLGQLAQIIDNGCNIGGTELAYIGEDLRQALARADIILSKGMANFEGLRCCGKNIYYLFLCKCRMFCDLFQVPQFTGMFLNDRRLPGGNQQK